jgi:hypothetical protein
MGSLYRVCHINPPLTWKKSFITSCDCQKGDMIKNNARDFQQVSNRDALRASILRQRSFLIIAESRSYRARKDLFHQKLRPWRVSSDFGDSLERAVERDSPMPLGACH